MTRLLPKTLPALALLLAGHYICMAQPGTAQSSPTDTPRVAARNWYDTLTVTQPRYARATRYETLALSAFTALAIPVALTVGAVTLIPPSIGVMVQEGKVRTGVVLSTGLGFGWDTTQIVFFPDWRVQAEAGYFFGEGAGPVVRGSVLFDKPLASISPRGFFWTGVAGGGGLATDFKSVSPYLEGWVGLMNPMGVRFLTLFPMHNYGIRGRAGYDVINGSPWYEIALSATSTFW